MVLLQDARSMLVCPTGGCYIIFRTLYDQSWRSHTIPINSTPKKEKRLFSFLANGARQFHQLSYRKNR